MHLGTPLRVCGGTTRPANLKRRAGSCSTCSLSSAQPSPTVVVSAGTVSLATSSQQTRGGVQQGSCAELRPERPNAAGSRRVSSRRCLSRDLPRRYSKPLHSGRASGDRVPLGERLLLNQSWLASTCWNAAVTFDPASDRNWVDNENRQAYCQSGRVSRLPLSCLDRRSVAGTSRQAIGAQRSSALSFLLVWSILLLISA